MMTQYSKHGDIAGLMAIYAPVKDQIVDRLEEFKHKWDTGSDEEIFTELTFCLLTPQSRARTCWAAVESLKGRCLIMEGMPDEILEELDGVRFKFRKAEYICEARAKFSQSGKLSIRSTIEGFSDPFKAREWLVENIKGLGYKEASHFLRNIGFGEDLAILDRHILRNLKLFGVIEEVPKSMTKKAYLDIESRMRIFSGQIGIPMGQLDLLLWYKEAGEIFK
ncbi:MAG TPA: N-glycosylase/DNA lyase [Methanotrichaceae archaeon]|nr:N-glycosylase/DNA lyase [Methanotrichaceae archaeon]